MKVRVSDYYGRMNYYGFMPKSMFRELERAWLAQAEYAQVSDKDYELMQTSWRNAVITGRTMS